MAERLTVSQPEQLQAKATIAAALIQSGTVKVDPSTPGILDFANKWEDFPDLEQLWKMTNRIYDTIRTTGS